MSLEQAAKWGSRHEVALLIGEPHSQLLRAGFRLFQRQLDDLVMDVRRSKALQQQAEPASWPALSNSKVKAAIGRQRGTGDVARIIRAQECNGPRDFLSLSSALKVNLGEVIVVKCCVANGPA